MHRVSPCACARRRMREATARDGAIAVPFTDL